MGNTMTDKEFGKIGWIDLTIDDATGVKDFYCAVMGWNAEEFPVADYHDYCVAPPNGSESASEPVAGICHRKGPNEGIPPQWLIYVTVKSIKSSVDACQLLGGEIVTPIRDMGSYGKMCVIRDPAGAVSAIIEPPA
jgi:predicted enzyme related to lactoylglutathione lyase